MLGTGLVAAIGAEALTVALGIWAAWNSTRVEDKTAPRLVRRPAAWQPDRSTCPYHSDCTLYNAIKKQPREAGLLAALIISVQAIASSDHQ